MAPETLKRKIICIAVILAALYPVVAAEARPLRHYDIGDTLSAFTLSTLEAQGETRTVAPVATGRPAVIMIFTASNEFHAKKAEEILDLMALLEGRYGARADFYSIYSDDRGMERIASLLQEKKRAMAILHDRDRELYNRYGVFIMPVALITSASGAIAQIVPYTHNMAELVEGNVQVVLGDWSQEQLRQMMNPQSLGVEKTPAEISYQRRLNYGLVMMERHMYAQGAREFALAIELMPAQERTYLELGFAQLALQDWEAARTSFKAGLARNQESKEAASGLALALYHLGEVEVAFPGLEAALSGGTPRPEILIALAEIYEKRGDLPQALRLYKSALSRLQGQHQAIMKNH